MSTVSLGMLDQGDPLYQVLALRVYPEVKRPAFHVERLSNHGLVYRYLEAQTRRAVVGKFFNPQDRDEDKVRRMKGEYRNLIRLRYLGFNAHPHSVVNPLCREERIGLAVAEEFVGGKDLDYYLARAADSGTGSALRETLVCLAAFLYRLHSRSANGATVRLEEVALEFARIVGKLEQQGLITAHHVLEYLRLRDRWLERPRMRTPAVTVHGDATPTNFLFPTRDDLVAIDLERMKEADRAVDVGMVCGEIKHAFLWRTGRLDTSEPFIHHFLERYTQDALDPAEAFWELTRRIPFYMALTELRIARNTWLDCSYRRRLVWEAHECLTWGLEL